MPEEFHIQYACINRLKISGSIKAQENTTIDLSKANFVSGTFIGSGQGLTNVTASYVDMNQGMSVGDFDYSSLEYDGPYGQFSRCTYRTGGSTGSIVTIIDAIYDGNTFMGVVKTAGPVVDLNQPI
jgi:hypothetical protein